LQARISKCEAFAGLAKCGWSVAWEWRSHDLATRNPSRRKAAYSNSFVICRFAFLYKFFIHRYLINKSLIGNIIFSCGKPIGCLTLSYSFGITVIIFSLFLSNQI